MKNNLVPATAIATIIALSLMTPPAAAYQPVPVASLSKEKQKAARAASIARNAAIVEAARQLKKRRAREVAEAVKARKDSKSVPGEQRHSDLLTMETNARARYEAASAAKFDAKARLARRKEGSLAAFVAGHDARALAFYNANNAAANRQAAAARQAAGAAATAQTSSASSSSTAQTSAPRSTAVAQTSSASSSSSAQTSSASSSAAPQVSGQNQFQWPTVPGTGAQTASSSSSATAQPAVGQMRRPMAAYADPSTVRSPQGAPQTGAPTGGYTPGPAGNQAAAVAQNSSAAGVPVQIYAGAPALQSYATPRALVAAVNRDLRQQAAAAAPRSSEGGYDQPNSTLKK